MIDSIRQELHEHILLLRRMATTLESEKYDKVLNVLTKDEAIKLRKLIKENRQHELKTWLDNHPRLGLRGLSSRDLKERARLKGIVNYSRKDSFTLIKELEEIENGKDKVR